MRQILTFIIIFIATAVFADEISNGVSLIAEGKFEQGCEVIHREYRKDSSSARVQFAYARTLSNGTEAKKLYTRLAQNTLTGDSIRAESFYRLGCCYYSMQQYDSAASRFGKAEKLVSIPVYSQSRALSVAAAGNYSSAEILFSTLLSKQNEDNSRQTLYYLGNVFFLEHRYDQAYTSYNKASSGKESPWSGLAIAGAFLSAHYTGDRRQSAILYNQLMKDYPALMEREQLKVQDTISPGTIKQSDSGAADDFGAIDFEAPALVEKTSVTAAPADKQQKYTLQVGAFGTQENAQSCYNEMKKLFGGVSIKKEQTNGTILHKIRVGTFSSEDEAREFGEKYLKPRNMTFRIVNQ